MAAAGGLGCGPKAPHSGVPTAPVTLVVTYAGTGVANAQVDLHNDTTGMGAGGTSDGSGKVGLGAVPLGEYTVTVLPPEANPLPPAPGEQPAPAVAATSIPQSVRDPRTSSLRATVVAGANEFAFELKDIK